jgi:zinc/manganese transport system substrate-binding protein
MCVFLLRRFLGNTARLGLWILWVCSGAAHANASPPVPLNVVASFSILANLVEEIGGERVNVTALAGPDTDAHHFQPRPSDAKKLAKAQLAVMNGLGFDDWMGRLARSSGFSGRLLAVSADLPNLLDENGIHGHRHGHSKDPHAWHDVANVRIYVKNISMALSEVDPQGQAHYKAQETRFLDALEKLDHEIRETLGRLPQNRRKVLVQHNAFAYLAKAYGLQILSVTGVSSHSEASGAHLAKLVSLIRKEGIAALFLENVRDDRMMENLKRETGVHIGGRLYSDALSGPKGPAPDYIGLMRHNLALLIQALDPTLAVPANPITK